MLSRARPGSPLILKSRTHVLEEQIDIKKNSSLRVRTPARIILKGSPSDPSGRGGRTLEPDGISADVWEDGHRNSVPKRSY